MNNYEEIVFVCFRISGKYFDKREPKCIMRVNAFLRQFRQKIEEVRIEKGELKGWVIRADEFISELIDSTEILCSLQVRFQCVDGENWALNRNNLIRPLIHQTLKSLSLWNNLKYGERLEATVLDVNFQGSPRRGRWPERRPIVVSA
jgi:hypothetical protein